MKSHPKERFTKLLPRGASVLDIGCWNYSYANHCNALGIKDFHHYGVDTQLPTDSAPAGYDFAIADVNKDPLPYPDQSLDGVVASHVIEHLHRPLFMMDEIFRVMKAGGLLYLECPSDRSLWLPSMPFKFHEFRSLNFYDDPTHVGRPYSPQSLFRLCSMYQAEILECRYLTSIAVRLRFPYLMFRSFLMRDAALLEFAMWWTFGFAAYGIARKRESTQRRYVLSH